MSFARFAQTLRSTSRSGSGNISGTSNNVCSQQARSTGIRIGDVKQSGGDNKLTVSNNQINSSIRQQQTCGSPVVTPPVPSPTPVPIITPDIPPPVLIDPPPVTTPSTPPIVEEIREPDIPAPIIIISPPPLEPPPVVVPPSAPDPVLPDPREDWDSSVGYFVMLSEFKWYEQEPPIYDQPVYEVDFDDLPQQALVLAPGEEWVSEEYAGQVIRGLDVNVYGTHRLNYANNGDFAL